MFSSRGLLVAVVEMVNSQTGFSSHRRCVLPTFSFASIDENEGVKKVGRVEYSMHIYNVPPCRTAAISRRDSAVLPFPQGAPIASKHRLGHIGDIGDAC